MIRPWQRRPPSRASARRRKQKHAAQATRLRQQLHRASLRKTSILFHAMLQQCNLRLASHCLRALPRRQAQRRTPCHPLAGDGSARRRARPKHAAAAAAVAVRSRSWQARLLRRRPRRPRLCHHEAVGTWEVADLSFWRSRAHRLVRRSRRARGLPRTYWTLPAFSPGSNWAGRSRARMPQLRLRSSCPCTPGI